MKDHAVADSCKGTNDTEGSGRGPQRVEPVDSELGMELRRCCKDRKQSMMKAGKKVGIGGVGFIYLGDNDDSRRRIGMHYVGSDFWD